MRATLDGLTNAQIELAIEEEEGGCEQVLIWEISIQAQVR